MPKFNLVVCGGTFDYLHKGQREFLRFALNLGSKLVIGLTGDEYAKSKERDVESFTDRKRTLLEFLKSEGAADKTEVVKINDVFGQTLDPGFQVQVIAVSEETKKGAEIINSKRLQIGLKPLPVFIFPFVLAENKKPIASFRIRSGEIDKEGKLYIKADYLTHNFSLPDDLRPKLKVPLGKLYKNGDDILFSFDPFKTITVGDVITKQFNDKNFGQKISVIDFYVERKEKFSNIKELGFLADEKVINVNNPAGTITAELFKAAVSSFNDNSQKRIVVKVNGEEDLSVLPFILAAPLSWRIFYGQPGVGVVEVLVSLETKNQARDILNRFVKSRY